MPAIVPCWGEPVVPWELVSWCFWGAGNSRRLNKPTSGEHWRLLPCRGVLTCQNEMLTLSSCLQDVPFWQESPSAPDLLLRSHWEGLLP